MSPNNYQEELSLLIPKEAMDVDCQNQEVGIRENPSYRIELRRWASSFQPLDYQNDLIYGIGQLIQKEPFCGLLSLPTGTGKTLTASRIVLNTMLNPSILSNQTVWIAPQRELLIQGTEALQSAWWAGHGSHSLDIRIVVKSKDFALANRPTCWLMTPIMAQKLLPVLKNRIGVVIFDEAHHVAAKVFFEIWNQLAHSTSKPLLSLGLSATPSREDLEEFIFLKRAFKETLILPKGLGTSPIQTLMDKGILANPVFKEIPNIPRYAKRNLGADSRSHRGIILDPERWNAIIQCITEYEKKQMVVFALNREHGQYLTKHLRFLGEKAEYVDGKTALPLRIGVFERFRNKETRIIVNVALLVEGVDCPSAESVLLTYPIRSSLRLQQMIGRILRGPAIGGTSEARVWAGEGSQQWLENILFGDEFSFSGWHIIELPLSK